jgi:hypothetical protein
VKTVVLQSAPLERRAWVNECMAGVARWAENNSFEHACYGDEFFDVLPVWYRQKLGGRGPILADLARLIHARSALQEGYEAVIWCDADTLIIDPLWQPITPSHSIFGHELWLQRDKSGRLEIRKQPHNAYLMFTATSPVLDFLIHTVESIIYRADPEHISPQMVGPKLLKALNTFADFDLEHAAGAMSPLLLDALLSDNSEITSYFKVAQTSPPKLMNLCASLVGSDDLDIEKIRAAVNLALC